MDTVGGFAAFLVLGVVGVAVLLGPLGRALAKWVESKAGESTPRGLAEAEHQRNQLESLSSRVTELEERLDFAERMLTQQREADRIGKGGA